jgi:glutathione synthase
MTEPRIRVAVVMDPIEDIKPAKDTTLAMMLAAQARGWELSYLELRHLWLRDGVATGRAHPVAVRDDPYDWFTLGDAQVERLGGFDVVLMRKDPPFDTEYVYSTYILERAEMQGALVVNRPQGLRDMNEKVFTAWFPECCAPTLITRDMADMHAFLREHGRVVCKPLYGMGGRSIFVVDLGDKNSSVVFETLTEYGERYAIVQRYIPDIVETGDSRVILVDGTPVPYALARIPSAGTTAATSPPAPPASGGRSTTATAGSRRRSARCCASGACCSWGSTSSADSSRRSTSRARPACASSSASSAST